MKVSRVIWLCTLAEAMSFLSWAQQPNRNDSNSTGKVEPTEARQGEKAAVATQRRLHLEVTPVPAEVAKVFQEPLKCDADGNLYLRTEPSGIGAIHKLNSKGEPVALYQPISPNVKVNQPLSFAISPDGEVSQLISALEPTRYVFVYAKDGSVKSEIKLQTGFHFFFPKQIAVFMNGDFLVSGLEYDSDVHAAMWPFTGIFASDGSLRKEITLKDDQKIHDMAASGDPKVSAPGLPQSNRAISSGKAETGADGNVYLMRRLTPAIVYAISPGGAVRRFEVDPGRQDMLPTSMHVVGSRIAVLFWQPQTHDEVLKVVDLQGHEIATYSEPAPKNAGEQSIGLAFVCYSLNPERFTFLETMEDSKLGLMTATP